ncbi:MAG: penicillin-binding transpeptidase domain-containing protein [Clostridia bacterium]
MGESFFKKMRAFLGSRFVILAVFFIAVGGLYILQLANLQLIQGKYYNEQANSRILSTRTIVAPRGDILDRNGVPIAVSKKAFSVLLLNTGLTAKDLNATLLKVYRILAKNKDDINRSLATYFSVSTETKMSFEKMLKLERINEELVKKVNLQLGLDFDQNEKVTPQAIFDQFLKQYKIDPSYSKVDAFNIMCMRFETRFFKATVPALLATDVSRKAVAEIEERQHLLSGVSTDTIPVRSYIDAKYIAHVLGYYRGEDSTGIESTMDAKLKGVDGLSKIDVNANGQLVETIDSKPAQSGKNVILTIDMELQKTAVKSLEKIIADIKAKKNGKVHDNNFSDVDSGAVVAMNPNNGEVLAMASYPSYDPNAFIAPKGDKKAQKKILNWFTDKKFPMMNRAISASYAPGSTYKLVVATAGLETGAIAPYSSNIYDPRVVVFDKIKRYCLEGGHGWLNLQKAIETSCNVYFYLLGVRTGIDALDKWAKLYGLGEATGIDLGGELHGERSNRETKKKYYGDSEGVWGTLNTALSSIGQYLNRFTPIQMARYSGALATNGKLVTPHVVQKVIDPNGKETKLIKIKKATKVPAKKITFDTIREGMKRVITEGTAAGAFQAYRYQDLYPAAGKTGTAQTAPHHSDNAAFICYAPADKPEIVVFVYLNKGVWGSWAAEVGRDVLNKYFDLKSDKGNPLPVVEEGPKLQR